MRWQQKDSGEVAIAFRRQVALAPWTAADIPSQVGKLAVVTGGCSGIGLEAALALARAGSDVLLADVDTEASREAVGFIRMRAPAGVVRHERLDLASLASIEAFAGRLLNAGRPLDLLINNAGLMALPRRETTVDGFEMQFGVNFLGHFALTARLLSLLRCSRLTRVVNVSSVFSQRGSIDLGDIQLAKRYRPWSAYAQSSLAMVIFAIELQRHSDARTWRLQSNVVHPGYARTNLFVSGPGKLSMANLIHQTAGRLLSQTAAQGALPLLFAGTAPKAHIGSYYCPRGPFELLGLPGEAELSANAVDPKLGCELWETATNLTGVSWPEN